MDKGAKIPLPSISDGVFVFVGDVIALAERRRSAFVGEQTMQVAHDARARTIHVISTYSGGEIRGYYLIGDALHLRLPSYPMAWPEIDDAVQAALSARAVHAPRSDS